MSESSRFVYLVTSATILLATGVLYALKPMLFRYFLGTLNPILIVSIIVILGFLLLDGLKQFGFLVYRSGAFFESLKVMSLSLVLSLIMVILDITVKLPEDINVVFPFSTLYYPVFGFIVEILFHLMPLFLILLVVKRVSVIDERVMFGCLVLVSFLEPFFQLGLGFSSQIPLWATVYVGLNIFLINIIQLCTFRRFGFAPMFTFRLFYYLFWHIIWGSIRLGYLF